MRRGSARFWRLGWVIGSTGDAELPADFLDHFRLYGCARLRLFAKLALLSAQLGHILDGLLFGLG